MLELWRGGVRIQVLLLLLIVLLMWKVAIVCHLVVGVPRLGLLRSALGSLVLQIIALTIVDNYPFDLPYLVRRTTTSFSSVQPTRSTGKHKPEK